MANKKTSVYQGATQMNITRCFLSPGNWRKSCALKMSMRLNLILMMKMRSSCNSSPSKLSCPSVKVTCSVTYQPSCRCVALTWLSHQLWASHWLPRTILRHKALPTWHQVISMNESNIAQISAQRQSSRPRSYQMSCCKRISLQDSSPMKTRKISLKMW